MNLIRPFNGNEKEPTYEIIDWNKTRGKMIIGYNQKFWAHCLEADRMKVSALARTEKHNSRAVRMKCDKNHIFTITPYMYFVEKRECIYCKCNDDRGAIDIDETILSFWDDKRFNIEDISEFSNAEFAFKCPFCGNTFNAPMSQMVNRCPKCVKCKDGQELLYRALLDEKSIYLVNSHCQKE